MRAFWVAALTAVGALLATPAATSSPTCTLCDKGEWADVVYNYIQHPGAFVGLAVLPRLCCPTCTRLAGASCSPLLLSPVLLYEIVSTRLFLQFWTGYKNALRTHGGEAQPQVLRWFFVGWAASLRFLSGGFLPKVKIHD